MLFMREQGPDATSEISPTQSARELVHRGAPGFLKSYPGSSDYVRSK
jgi:hypothetical protein